jgi:RNA polymerase sigma-70 factor (ECF subfamily)
MAGEASEVSGLRKAAVMECDRPQPANFEEIVRRHQSMVFSIAYHFLQDRPSAEEAAQDVFLQLYQTGPVLESEAHLTFWLRKVACHRSIDYARRRKLRVHVSLDRIPEPASPAEQDDVLLWGRLRALLQTLPQKTRMIVILRYQEGMELEEIASVMGIPTGTVKSQLQRGLARLRQKVERSLGEVRL